MAIFRQLAAQSQAMDYNGAESWPVTSLRFVSCLLLVVLTSVAAARCPEPNPSWIVDDDRINGVISVDGRPLKEAKIKLSSTAHYTAVTDGEGAFLIPNVAVGSYSFVVKGWGEAHLQVRDWHRGGINRPVLLFNSIKQCLLLTVVSN